MTRKKSKARESLVKKSFSFQENVDPIKDVSCSSKKNEEHYINQGLSGNQPTKKHKKRKRSKRKRDISELSDRSNLSPIQCESKTRESLVKKSFSSQENVKPIKDVSHSTKNNKEHYINHGLSGNQRTKKHKKRKHSERKRGISEFSDRSKLSPLSKSSEVAFNNNLPPEKKSTSNKRKKRKLKESRDSSFVVKDNKCDNVSTNENQKPHQIWSDVDDSHGYDSPVAQDNFNQEKIVGPKVEHYFDLSASEHNSSESELSYTDELEFGEASQTMPVVKSISANTMFDLYSDSSSDSSEDLSDFIEPGSEHVPLRKHMERFERSLQSKVRRRVFIDDSDSESG